MNRGYDGKKHIVDVAFVFALLGIFVILAVTVVVFGANAYRKNSEGYTQSYDERTSLVYIIQKLHSSSGKSVSIGKVDGNDALIISGESGGEKYDVVIFASGGKLREVMTVNASSVQPTDGQEIMSLNALRLEMRSKNLLSVSVENTDGTVKNVLIRTDMTEL